MITKGIVEETYTSVIDGDFHLIFIPPYDPNSWREYFSDEEWSTILDVIGDDFITVDSHDWSSKERFQMETVIDICANQLDI